MIFTTTEISDAFTDIAAILNHDEKSRARAIANFLGIPVTLLIATLTYDQGNDDDYEYRCRYCRYNPTTGFCWKDGEENPCIGQLFEPSWGLMQFIRAEWLDTANKHLLDTLDYCVAQLRGFNPQSEAADEAERAMKELREEK